MGNDIFQFKPNFHGIGVDFNALWKKVRKQPASPFEKVAARFVELFDQHGVAVTQIPRLLPSIGLAQLASPARLLAALTPEVLQKTCALFGVRHEWLEGTSEQIYEHRFCYKMPHQFFEELDALAPAAMISPVRAFTTVKQLNYRASRSQRLELVLVEEKRGQVHLQPFELTRCGLCVGLTLAKGMSGTTDGVAGARLTTLQW